MYKSLFISLNIVGMIMVPIFYIGDISVTQSGSSQVSPGDEIEVTINISKEGVSGPARLKLDLTNAQGIEIEDIETEGASFSYNEESALFIWYSIKPAANVVIKYRIIADADASGSKTITGEFSYLDVDERKKKDIQPFSFSVSGDGSVASTKTVDPIVEEGGEDNETVDVVTPSSETTSAQTTSTQDNSEQNNSNNTENNSSNNQPTANNETNNTTTETNEVEQVVAEGSDDEDEKIEAVSTNTSVNTNNSTPSEKVTCKRSIEKSGDDFIVSISIYKGINGGFARIKEDVPAGFTAKSVETAGSIFKFADNSAKFLWSQVPRDEEEIVVKYKLTPSSSASGSYNLEGDFSAEFLIENDKPKKLNIDATAIEVAPKTTASNDNSTSSSSNSETKSSSSTKSTPSSSSNSSSNTSTSNNNSSSTSIGSTSTNGVKYRVQIIAAHNTVSKRYISKAFGYNGSVNIENHEGWVKYTTNGFKSYKEARDNRNTLNQYRFDGPFVTAYNNGDRITVQEALMLSSQSWMQ